MLKLLVMLASIANCAGGLVLIATWATMWQHVPIIVLFIGGSLLIQGAYTILYLRGDLDRWADLATGALFAGEGLSACVGAGGAIQGIIHNIQNANLGAMARDKVWLSCTIILPLRTQGAAGSPVRPVAIGAPTQ